MGFLSHNLKPPIPPSCPELLTVGQIIQPQCSPKWHKWKFRSYSAIQPYSSNLD